MQKFHGLKVLKSCRDCSLITMEPCYKSISNIFENNHIFSSTTWHLPREIFDLATESLNKLRRQKKHSGWLQRRKLKWGVNIRVSTTRAPGKSFRWYHIANYHKYNIFQTPVSTSNTSKGRLHLTQFLNFSNFLWMIKSKASSK